MKRANCLFTSLICLLLILTFLSTFSGCQDDSSFENLSTTMPGAQTSKDEATGAEGSENSNTVIFYSDEGVILGKDDVPKGGTPETPQGSFKEGYVFTGWRIIPGSESTEVNLDTGKTTAANTQDNTQDSTQDNPQDADLTLPSIDEDVDFEANYIDIKDKSNVFAMPAVYGKNGDTINAKLQLCGKVDLCAFDIQISYDPLILELASINSDLDLDVVASHDEANHMIKFNYAAAKNRTRTAEIMEISFKVRSAEKAKTLIQLKALEIITIDANNENLPIPAPFTLIDGMVYIK